MNRNIVALDISTTSTGIAYVTDSFGTQATVRKKTMSSHDYASQLINDIMCLTDTLTLPIVFIEGYAYGKFGKSSSVTALAELNGIVKHTLWCKALTYYTIPPTTIKQFLSGKGNLKKDQVPLCVYKKYHIEPGTTDECDALALADLGHSIFYGRSIRGDLCGYEAEIVKKLKISLDICD